MTIKERVISLVGYAVDDNSVEGALIDNDLTGETTYGKEHSSSATRAAITVLEGLILSSVSEGGYSVSYDRKGIEARIRGLKTQLGENKDYTISDVSHLW